MEEAEIEAQIEEEIMEDMEILAAAAIENERESAEELKKVAIAAENAENKAKVDNEAVGDAQVNAGLQTKAQVEEEIQQEEAELEQLQEKAEGEINGVDLLESAAMSEADGLEDADAQVKADLMVLDKAEEAAAPVDELVADLKTVTEDEKLAAGLAANLAFIEASIDSKVQWISDVELAAEETADKQIKEDAKTWAQTEKSSIGEAREKIKFEKDLMEGEISQIETVGKPGWL